MSITVLTHNTSFLEMMSRLKTPRQAANLFETFEHFASSIEHNDRPDYIIVDAELLGQGDRDIWAYLEAQKIPCVVVDRAMEILPDKIEPKTYPSNTIAVLTREMLQPWLFNNVMDILNQHSHSLPYYVQEKMVGMRDRWSKLWSPDGQVATPINVRQ